MQCGHAAERAWQPAYTLWYLFHWRRWSSCFSSASTSVCPQPDIARRGRQHPEEPTVRQQRRRLRRSRTLVKIPLCTSGSEGLRAADEEEDLTPEERRKLERKLKKERKKEEKKLMREAGISTKKAEPKKLSGSELALAYLTSWSENPEEWKFQKTRQTWLLSHMYEKEKVPDEYFTILLDYLQGLKGSARDTTVQKAEALMQELDGSDVEDPSAMEKCERIRQVLQLLS